MNAKMNIPAMQQIMMEFEKQNEMMGMKEDMMNDAIDDVMDDEVRTPFPIPPPPPPFPFDTLPLTPPPTHSSPPHHTHTTTPHRAMRKRRLTT